MAEGDNYIHINTRNGMAALSKGGSISEGDNYLTWKTKHGPATHGTSTISEGDTILFVPTNHGLIAVKGGGICGRAAYVPIQNVGSGESKTYEISLMNLPGHLIGIPDDTMGWWTSFIAYGDVDIIYNDETLYSESYNGDEVNFIFSFENEELSGKTVQLVFTENGSGKIGVENAEGKALLSDCNLGGE